MNFTPRAAEHTHSVRCAAKAMITAIENVRDSVQDADVDQSISFAIYLQDNPWYDARANLQDGVSECICPPCSYSCCEFYEEQKHMESNVPGVAEYGRRLAAEG